MKVIGWGIAILLIAGLLITVSQGKISNNPYSRYLAPEDRTYTRRDEQPVTFWAYVLLYLAITAFWIWFVPLGRPNILEWLGLPVF